MNTVSATVFKEAFRTAMYNQVVNTAAEDAFFKKNVGLLGLLTSPANQTASIFDLQNIEFSDGNGRFRSAGLSFRELKGPSFTSNGEWRFSSDFSGTSNYPKFVQLKLELAAQSEDLVLDNDVLNKIAMGSDEWFTPQIQEHLRNFLVKVGAMVAQRVVTGGFIGKFPKLTPDMTESERAPFKDLALFNSDGKTVNYMGEIALEQDAQNLSQMGGMFKVGGSRLGAYRSILNYTSLVQLNIDAGVREVIGTWNEDIGVTTYGSAFATSPMIAFVPGSLQLVTFNHRVGDFVIDEEMHKVTTFIEPYFGLPLTMVYKKTLVEKTVSGRKVEEYVTYMRYELDGFDVIGLKNTQYTDNPAFEGVNGVVAYDIVAGDLTIADMKEWKTTTFGLTTKAQDVSSGYEAATVGILAAATYEIDGDDLSLDPTVSEAATGATLTKYGYVIGTTTITAGLAASTISGVTGVSGTYGAPVFDLTEFEGVTKIKVTAVDSALNTASTYIYF